MSRAAEIVRKGLEVQAEVENYGEDTVTITGPVDLHELAVYIDKAMAKSVTMSNVKTTGPITITGVGE